MLLFIKDMGTFIDHEPVYSIMTGWLTCIIVHAAACDYLYIAILSDEEIIIDNIIKSGDCHTGRNRKSLSLSTIINVDIKARLVLLGLDMDML